MLLQIIIGLMLVGLGAILVYFSRLIVTNLMPEYSNENRIMTVKVIGFALVVLGAFVIFFFGVGELQVRGY